MRWGGLGAAIILLAPAFAVADYYDGERAFDSRDYATAASEWRTAAFNDARAQLRLAQLYERGLGVPQSTIDAFVWYSRAAEEGGLIEAQSALTSLRPTMSDEDVSEALSRLDKPGISAEQGQPAVQLASEPGAGSTGPARFAELAARAKELKGDTISDLLAVAIEEPKITDEPVADALRAAAAGQDAGVKPRVTESEGTDDPPTQIASLSGLTDYDPLAPVAAGEGASESRPEREISSTDSKIELPDPSPPTLRTAITRSTIVAPETLSPTLLGKIAPKPEASTRALPLPRPEERYYRADRGLTLDEVTGQAAEPPVDAFERFTGIRTGEAPPGFDRFIESEAERAKRHEQRWGTQTAAAPPLPRTGGDEATGRRSGGSGSCPATNELDVAADTADSWRDDSAQAAADARKIRRQVSQLERAIAQIEADRTAYDQGYGRDEIEARLATYRRDLAASRKALEAATCYAEADGSDDQDVSG